MLCLLLGCAGTAPYEEQPLAAADMPLSFSYGALGQEDAAYRGATQTRSGWTVRRLQMSDGGEFALFDLVSLGGDYGLHRRDTRTWVSTLLQSPEQASWGETAREGGARPTEMRLFTLPDGIACVGLQRCTAEHADAAPGTYCQALAVGLYCRAGKPIDTEEARKVAAALRS
jgi:hypothetical protein